jgi:hypothetical protein
MDKTFGEYHFTRLDTVIFGAGKVEDLGRELSRRGAKRALIVTGKTLGRSKLLDRSRRRRARRSRECLPARRSMFLRRRSRNSSPRRAGSRPTR